MTHVPTEDSDQPGHLPTLIRIFTVLLKKGVGSLSILKCTGKSLIRLGWSETLLGAQAILLVLLRFRSFCISVLFHISAEEEKTVWRTKQIWPPRTCVSVLEIASVTLVVINLILNFKHAQGVCIKHACSYWYNTSISWTRLLCK